MATRAFSPAGLAEQGFEVLLEGPLEEYFKTPLSKAALPVPKPGQQGGGGRLCSRLLPGHPHQTALTLPHGAPALPR